MKRILGLVLLSICFNVSAGLSTDNISSAGWKNLSDAQQADLLKAVADTAAQNAQSNVGMVNTPISPSKIDEWVQLGPHIGQAFSGAAKEIGIATNEFVTTPVGKLAMILIVWHFIGGAVVHIFGALLILIVGFSFVQWHRRSLAKEERIYDPEKRDYFGRSCLVRIDRDSVSTDWDWAYWWSALFIIVGSTTVLFTF